MKKKLIVLVLIVSMIVMAFTLTGCSKSSEIKSFNVHFDDKVLEISDKAVGKTVNLADYAEKMKENECSFTKEGYALVGFYDAQDKLYFNNQGKLVDSNSKITEDDPYFPQGFLSSDFPTDVYAKWVSIDEITPVTNTMYDDKEYSFGKDSLLCFAFYESVTVSNKKGEVQVDVPNMIMNNAIAGNPNQIVNVVLTFTAFDKNTSKGDATWAIKLKKDLNSKSTELDKKEINITSEAKVYTVEFQTTTEALQLNRVILEFERDNGIFKAGYIKDFSAKVTFN